MMEVFFYVGMVVVTAFILRCLYVLGRTVRERDEARWSVQQLLDQNKLVVNANQILAAQNSNLIQYNAARAQLAFEDDEDDDDPYVGNIFPTE